MAQVSVTGRLVSNPKKFFEGEMNEYGKHKFSALIVLDEDQIPKVEKAKKKALEDTFDGKVPTGLVDWVLREGDDEEYQTTFGRKFINAGATKKPKVVRKIEGAIQDVDADDGVFYTGCDVVVSIDVYAYKGDKTKKIKAGATVGLRAIMFLRDNDPIGNVVNADNEFADFESEDEDFDI